jgi:hypothetical protein
MYFKINRNKLFLNTLNLKSQPELKNLNELFNSDLDLRFKISN